MPNKWELNKKLRFNKTRAIHAMRTRRTTPQKKKKPTQIKLMRICYKAN